MIYYGLAMIILAAALFFGSGYLFSNGIGKTLAVKNFTVGADNFTSFPINYTNASELAVYVISAKPINVYLLNITTYHLWSSHMLSAKSDSGVGYAQQLGVVSNDIFKNSSFAIIPVLVNSSKNYSKNRVYVVMDNTFGSHSFNGSVNTTLSYFPLHSSKLLVYELLDVLAFVILIAGIIIIVWGLVRSGEPKMKEEMDKPLTKDQKQKEYVDQLYKGVKKSKMKKQKENDNS